MILIDIAFGIATKALIINVATKQNKWKIAYLCEYYSKFCKAEVNPQMYDSGFYQCKHHINLVQDSKQYI